MKKHALSFVLLAGLLFILAQCGSADKGTKIANTFFASIIKKDFEKAAGMVELPLGDTTDILMQLKRMENNSINGQLQDFKKLIGFKTNMSNGIATIELPYRLKYEKGGVSFNVVIQNKGKGYKIVAVQ